MSKLSVLLLCLLIPSLCDIVSMYHTSKQIQDLATLTDLEGSGSDDEDEGFYSGSGGSGYFEFDTKLRFTTGVTRAVTSTPSTSAFGSIQPFAFTFRSTTLTSGSSARVLDPTSAALTTQQAVTAAPAPATVPAAAATTTLRVTTASTGAATTSTVKTPATHSSTIAVVPLATTGVTATTKQSMTSPGAVARPVSTPDPQTSRATLESFTMDTSKTLLSIPYITEKPSSSEQVEETTINNEVEAPAAGSPSGDFELTEEGEVVNPEGNNEVFAAITQPTVRGTGKIGLPDIIDNAIDSGSSSSAAQLPQKNILERKEVLVAVVVGGVVGALFAAFLVMLLIYRMKKKDEGSYTLEEPKQASIAYQKPDIQEEFYA
ncbi:LOW QUALITY PROTEIN: syndecan-3-like [Pristis pectinata]|uniref:LOW QUALITY PROTEIN: syndecan-3-like n=1 Tax=Pristis pectinata TaxID=685728 RepID=UPI00223D1808|nr:LOW QUALITY PROTEIN: syndecan-3-like [Pristis pectinata]